METLKDLFGSIRDQVMDRVGNPLTASFVLAWPVANYKLVLILFADGPWYPKVWFIERDLYAGWWEPVLRGFLIPIIFALFYVYIYQRITLPVVKSYRSRQIQFKQMNLELDGVTPLTHEEAQRLRARFKKREMEQSEHIKRLTAEVEDLQAVIQVKPPVEIREVTQAERHTRMAADSAKKRITRPVPEIVPLNFTDAQLNAIAEDYPTLAGRWTTNGMRFEDALFIAAVDEAMRNGRPMRAPKTSEPARPIVDALISAYLIRLLPEDKLALTSLGQWAREAIGTRMNPYLAALHGKDALYDLDIQTL